MYKLCKTEQSAARQRELERGLLNAMAECPYAEISISDLCQQMGIPRKSFYRYFSGKEGAFHALIDHTIMEFEGLQWIPGKKEPQDWQHELECFFCFWMSKKPLLDALNRNGLMDVFVERAVDHAMEETGLSRLFYARQEPQAQIHRLFFLVSGLMTMMIAWYRQGYPCSPEHMARIAAGIVTKPLVG